MFFPEKLLKQFPFSFRRQDNRLLGIILQSSSKYYRAFCCLNIEGSRIRYIGQRYSTKGLSIHVFNFFNILGIYSHLLDDLRKFHSFYSDRIDVRHIREYITAFLLVQDQKYSYRRTPSIVCVQRFSYIEQFVTCHGTDSVSEVELDILQDILQE